MLTRELNCTPHDAVAPLVDSDARRNRGGFEGNRKLTHTTFRLHPCTIFISKCRFYFKCRYL
jgi:hypothetical protein